MNGREHATTGPAFSVVIPTLARPDDLATALASLARCDPRPAQVVVVDGEGSPETAGVVEAARAEAGLAVEYVTAEAGTSRQRNAGLARASGDAVLFADDDVVFGAELFAVLARPYEDPAVVGATVAVAEPVGHRVGGASSRLRRFLPGGGGAGAFTRYGYPRYLPPGSPDRDVEIDCGLMSARRWAAEAVRFDERLTGYGLAEDEDFARRLARLGRIRYCSGITVEHRKRGFAARDPYAFGRKVVVNRTYLFRKNFPQTRRARAEFALFLGALLVHRLLNRDWRGAAGVVAGLLARPGVAPRPEPARSGGSS
jgi:GT2 family glycosyltransferase